MHRAGLEGQAQRLAQQGEAFDVTADAQQPPAIVARHAVGLRAGDGAEHFGELFEPAQRLRQGQLLAAGLGGQEFERGGRGDPLAVIAAQAFAHLRGGMAQRLDVLYQSASVRAGHEAAHQAPFESLRVVAQRRGFGVDQARLTAPPVEHVAHGRAEVVVARECAQGDACQPRAMLGAFAIAAEPEQVFRRPAGDHAMTVDQVLRAHRRGQQGGFVHRVAGDDPGVLAAAAALHRHGVAAARRGAHQPAGQHAPAAPAVRQGIDAQHGGTRREAVVAPDRHMRQRLVLLQGDARRVGLHPFAPGRELAVIEAGHDGGLEAAFRMHRLDHPRAQIVERRVAHPRLAAPPGGQRRQFEGFAQQGFAQLGQKALHRGRFEKTGPQCIGHQHMPGAHGLQQAGDAQHGIGAQLQRVAEAVVKPSQHHVHRLQAAQGLEVEPVFAHGQVAAFGQGDAQIARQIHLLEIGFAVRAGGEQHNAAAGAAGRQPQQRVHQQPVARGQALHLELAERVREQARDQDAVFQQITQARRRLHPLVDHAPHAVGPARQIEGGDVQPDIAGRRMAVQRAQIAGMALHQRRGQQPFLEGALGAGVEVGEYGIEQSGALRGSGGNLLPRGRVDQQREQVDRPGAHGLGRIGVDVVGHAVVVNLLPQLLLAGAEVVETAGANQAEKVVPQRGERGAGLAVGHLAAQLVPMPRNDGRRQIAGERRAFIAGVGAVLGRGLKQTGHMALWHGGGGRHPLADPRFRSNFTPACASRG